MANVLTNLIPAIIAKMQETLRQEFALIKYVGRNFSAEFAQRGKTLTIPYPAALDVETVTPAATPPAANDVTPPTSTVTLDQFKGCRFNLAADEALQLIEGNNFVGAQIGEAVRKLLYTMNALVFSKYPGIYGWAGTAGTTPFTSDLSAAAGADKALNNQLCPAGNRFLIINNAAREKALLLANFNEALKRGDTAALRKGELGNLFGMDIFNDSQVPEHTHGTGAGYLINKTGGYAAGASTVAVDTGSGTILVGDIVSFAGHDQTYAVTVALSGNAFTFTPTLKAAVADNAAITVKKTAVTGGTKYPVNLAFDPMAFGFGIRLPAENIEGAEPLGQRFPFTDPVTGIPLLLCTIPGYHLVQWQVCALYGGGLIQAERACRVAG